MTGLDGERRTADWRAAIARVIGDHEALAAEVAAQLDEPLEDVRATLDLWLVLHGVGATVADLDQVVDSLRVRSRQGMAPRARARSIDAASLDELLAWTLRSLDGRRPDPDLVVAVQRAAGAIAARTGVRPVVLLARLAFMRRLIWTKCVGESVAGHLDPAVLPMLGEWLLLWTELTSLAVTDGYRAAEREILVRDAEARRAVLDELLGSVAADPMGIARARRVAARSGLDPDLAYRLVAVAPGPETDPTPDRPGLDHRDLDLLAGRIGHLLGAPTAAMDGAGAGIRLPAVLALRGRLVILAPADWAGLARVPAALDRVLDPPRRPAGRRPPSGREAAEAAGAARASWLAVASGPVDGVADLAACFTDLADAVRTAELIGRRGWIADPEALAVERLLLASRELGDSAVAWELGALLADARMGEELLETLRVYLDAGENMRETARRMHLANRTVAYRLERVEEALGGPLDGERMRRLSVALLVRSLLAGERPDRAAGPRTRRPTT